MVFGFFNRKVAKERVFVDANRTEQHFGKLMADATDSHQAILDEVSDLRERLLPLRDPAMFENFLRLQERAYGIAFEHHFEYAVPVLQRLGARQGGESDDVRKTRALFSELFRFLTDISSHFDSLASSRQGVFALLYNRQMDLLAQLVKIAVMTDEAPKRQLFDAAVHLLSAATKRGMLDIEVAPYPGLFPEEVATVRKGSIRLHLLAALAGLKIRPTEVELADGLLRSVDIGESCFSAKAEAAKTATHYIDSDPQVGRIHRMHPGVKPENVASYLCAKPMIDNVAAIRGRLEGFASQGGLGARYAELAQPMRFDQALEALKGGVKRSSDRIAVSMKTEVFTDITDCLCYLRRNHMEYMIALSDEDPRNRPLSVYERFEDNHFGHISSQTRGMVNETLFKRLLQDMDRTYQRRNVVPDIWQVEDVSAGGYGLSMPKEVAPPPTDSIVILSKEEDDGMEFAVVRRVKSNGKAHLVGVETMFGGAQIEPAFIRSCSPKQASEPYRRTEPHGFLLTGPSGDAMTLLLPKVELLPLRAGVVIRVMGREIEGLILSAGRGGSNWHTYVFEPLARFK